MKVKPYSSVNKRKDGASGLSYFGARYYDSNVGRWTQKDPLGMINGPNKYLYCGNNPVSFIDPWGLRKGGNRGGGGAGGGNGPGGGGGFHQNTTLTGAGGIVDEAIAKTTLWQALIGSAGENVDQDRRYIDTEILKTIDLQHVVSAAMGPPGASTIGGFMVESKQLYTDPSSAFKTEDLISNVLGGIAADRANQRGTSIGQEVERIIKDARTNGVLYGRD